MDSRIELTREEFYERWYRVVMTTCPNAYYAGNLSESEEALGCHIKYNNRITKYIITVTNPRKFQLARLRHGI